VGWRPEQLLDAAIAWAAHVTPGIQRLDSIWIGCRGAMSDPKSLRANARRYRELKGKEITWPLPAY
jgi:enoyl-CoA hydratase